MGLFLWTGYVSPVKAEDAIRVARDAYELDAAATPLPGERDLNFRLEAGDGGSYLLKFHHPDADPGEIDFQTAALEHVAGLPLVPRVIPTSAGEMSLVDGDRIVRLLSWLDGRTWAESGPHDAARRESLGRAVARLDRALAGFRHPAEERPLLWSLASAPEVAGFVDLVAPEKQDVVRGVFEHHREVVAPRLASLPQQVIHNDANELNILVGSDGAVSGLIDFGDAVWSPRVGGLAVAAAYAMLGERDPIRAALPVVAGYDAEWPLRPDELEVLFDLIRLRLAASVAMAAWQHANDPGNEYLLVSQDAVWPTLERLAAESTDLAHFRFRDACGWDAVPWSRHVRQFFESGRARTAPVLPVDVSNGRAVVLDLGAGGFDPLDPAELAAACADIEERIEREGAEFAIGLYKEDRTIYRAPQFDLGDGRRRSLHMAVDLWLAAGTPVHAALDGVAAVVANNPAPLDFGGLVLLEHATDAGVPFWTLYGHLDPESLELSVGDAVAAGGQIARLGDVPVNGGWPPHLHLQLVTSLCDLGADVPGVAAPDEASLWESISPDPNLILLRRDGDEARLPRPGDEIARRRRGNLSSALSIAYREPLHIVRGEGAYLYDDAGNAFLDLVNNVAHVGHCHPRVVAAGTRQMGILNTNTRYLHDSIVRYAHRLAASLPDPLRVVFLVNSGSEANDLALRLATAHTGRDDVLVLDHAYHGHLSSTIALSPYKFDGPGGTGKPATTHVCELPDPYRGRLRAGEPDLGAATPTPCASRRKRTHPPRSSSSRSPASAARSSSRTAISPPRSSTSARPAASPWPTRCRSVSAASATPCGASSCRALSRTWSRSASRSATATRSRRS